MKDGTFFLIRSDILPEAVLKTVEAKELLASGKAGTVGEAVERVGLSRSAFYKYKDGIYPFNAMMKEQIMTVSLNLEHRAGVLSQVLGYVARAGGNVLTINQTIPLQGSANVVMSVDTLQMKAGTEQFLEGLRQVDGVSQAFIVGRSETI